MRTFLVAALLATAALTAAHAEAPQWHVASKPMCVVNETVDGAWWGLSNNAKSSLLFHYFDGHAAHDGTLALEMDGTPVFSVAAVAIGGHLIVPLALLPAGEQSALTDALTNGRELRITTAARSRTFSLEDADAPLADFARCSAAARGE
jgi:hypothetical protein